MNRRTFSLSLSAFLFWPKAIMGVGPSVQKVKIENYISPIRRPTRTEILAAIRRIDPKELRSLGVTTSN